MKFRWSFLWIALLIVIVLFKFNSFQAALSATSASSAKTKANSSEPAVKVMLIGSSVAEGWDDKTGGGYLKRAFTKLSQYQHINYTLISEAKAGDTVMKVANQYPQWLKSVKPQIVVLSWGILDDLSDHTSVAAYSSHFREEIALALAAKAKVYVVTPPITRASYTQYKVQEAQLVNIEKSIAANFHSSNVLVYDVFNQMKSYIASHHQTYVPYMADGWHPNTKGHALAGQLLFQDIKSQHP